MRSQRSVIVPPAFMRSSGSRAVRDSRSTRRTVSIAKPATSRTRRKTLHGCRPKAAADVATAAKLADRVIQKEPDNRAARLALAVAAIAKGEYGTARTDLSQSARGAFTELTLVLLDAWASAGAGNLKSADTDLAQV